MKWFSIEGVSKEAKKVRWPNSKEMAKHSTTVFVFVCAFAAYFVVADMIVSAFLKIVGIGE